MACEGYVFDERIEASERLIDALSWFGDAAFEPSPGAKIAKLVTLLVCRPQNIGLCSSRLSH
jgi:hypothetical protein